MCILLFLFCISSIQPYVAGKYELNCTLPPRHKHGTYLLIQPALASYPEPGQKFTSYTIHLQCELGYELVSPPTQTCFEDGSLSYPTEDFECMPFCILESNHIITSCGGEPRCMLPPQYRELAESRVSGTAEPVQKITNEGRECGHVGTPESYVSGGRKAYREELPWHAAIYTKRKTPYMQICGGSLVSSTVVISAAHCFWSEVEKQLPASDYAVAVGKIYRPWNNQHDDHAQKSDVAEIKIPPYFHGSATNLQDDIALVIVVSPFNIAGPTVGTVCLDFNLDFDKQQLSPGNYGKVAGWGLTSEDGPASPVLKVVQMPVINIKQCFEQSDTSFHAHITGDKICAGYQNGTAVCKGDSGGGLSFVDVSSGFQRYYLRGVVSGAPRSDHLCNTYTWASFTHLLKHEHFIRETVPAELPSADAPLSAIPTFF